MGRRGLLSDGISICKTAWLLIRNIAGRICIGISIGSRSLLFYFSPLWLESDVLYRGSACPGNFIHQGQSKGNSSMESPQVSQLERIWKCRSEALEIIFVPGAAHVYDEPYFSWHSGSISNFSTTAKALHPSHNGCYHDGFNGRGHFGWAAIWPPFRYIWQEKNDGLSSYPGDCFNPNMASCRWKHFNCSRRFWNAIYGAGSLGNYSGSYQRIISGSTAWFFPWFRLSIGGPDSIRHRLC